ncbi:hypothetical protein Scep_010071 [Stephania cephalantha]|uniref:Uncharacterized protein n=1 Tax=Stephania cephalantha TaxID=152367 RepID=A0AAP0JVD3_9MAGN
MEAQPRRRKKEKKKTEHCVPSSREEEDEGEPGRFETGSARFNPNPKTNKKK